VFFMCGCVFGCVCFFMYVRCVSCVCDFVCVYGV